jgi:hypothetical protein
MSASASQGRKVTDLSVGFCPRLSHGKGTKALSRTKKTIVFMPRNVHAEITVPTKLHERNDEQPAKPSLNKSDRQLQSKQGSWDTTTLKTEYLHIA